MAQQHNELRRSAEIGAAVKRIVGETDSESTVERFGETLTPILDIWRLPEWARHRQEIRWASQPTSIGPVAAQFSFVQLFNPAASGRLVVVERVIANRITAGAINGALTVTVRGASLIGLGVPTDTRWDESLLQREPGSFSSGTVAAFGGDIQIATDGGFGAGASKEMLIPTPIILAPFTGFVVSNNTINEAIQVQLIGYSRALRPDELT